MSNNKLYVGNLSYQTGEEKLREAFSAYGTVSSVTIIEGKGFGFVEMESGEAAQSAKEALDGKELDGRNIKVDEARPKPKRSGGGFGGGGGGGGGYGGGGGRGRDRDSRKRGPRY
ncbi:MAG: RNA-binding protein [candidate division Zixibacteria bacterium]|nr:RNA-binding protein [candidate division Zixibacteria bacterium]